jgi:hypothetical protein
MAGGEIKTYEMSLGWFSIIIETRGNKPKIWKGILFLNVPQNTSDPLTGQKL